MTEYIVVREKFGTFITTTKGVLVAKVFDSFEGNQDIADVIVRQLNRQGVTILDQIKDLIEEERRSMKNESKSKSCGAV